MPKTNDAAVEMMRQVKVAKDIAVNARDISLKQGLVNAPAELREQLESLSKMALIDRRAG